MKQFTHKTQFGESTHNLVLECEDGQKILCDIKGDEARILIVRKNGNLEATYAEVYEDETIEENIFNIKSQTNGLTDADIKKAANIILTELKG